MTLWTNWDQPFGTNRAPLLTGWASDNSNVSVPVAVDPATGRVLVSSSGGAITNYALETGGNLATVVNNTTGLSTSANQTNGNQLVKLTDGTNTANVLKSDGSAAGNNALMIGGAGQTQAYSTTSSGALTAYLVEGYDTVSVDIIAPLTGGTTQFQISNDNTNWRSLRLVATDASDYASTPGATGTTYAGPLHGAKYFRLYLSGSGGTASGTVQFSTLGDSSPITSYVVTNADAVAVKSTTAIIPVTSSGYVYNGSSWDRIRSGGVMGMQGVSLQASPSGGYSYTHVAAGQATTVVKNAAGTLHSITFNGPATATNTTTLYDNASGSGTVIGIPLATAVVSPETVVYDIAFANGLTIITATANGADMTIAYK